MKKAGSGVQVGLKGEGMGEVDGEGVVGADGGGELKKAGSGVQVGLKGEGTGEVDGEGGVGVDGGLKKAGSGAQVGGGRGGAEEGGGVVEGRLRRSYVVEGDVEWGGATCL